MIYMSKIPLDKNLRFFKKSSKLWIGRMDLGLGSGGLELEVSRPLVAIV